MFRPQSRRRFLANAGIGLGSVLGSQGPVAAQPTLSLLEITKEGSPRGLATYEVTVTGDIFVGEDFERNGTDEISGQTVSGEIGPHSGTDSFVFSGELVSHEVNGPASVFLNGELLETSGGSDGQKTAETSQLRLSKEGQPFGRVVFMIEVDGQIINQDAFEGAIEGGRAVDSLGPFRGIDEVEFTGDVETLLVAGPATVTIDGEDVTRTRRKAPFPTNPLPNRLLLTKEGAPDNTVAFAVTVSGIVSGGATFEGATDGKTAIDVFGPEQGVDDVRYSGEITSFLMNGEATILQNGTEVDPADL